MSSILSVRYFWINIWRQLEAAPHIYFFKQYRKLTGNFKSINAKQVRKDEIKSTGQLKILSTKVS